MPKIFFLTVSDATVRKVLLQELINVRQHFNFTYFIKMVLACLKAIQFMQQRLRHCLLWLCFTTVDRMPSLYSKGLSVIFKMTTEQQQNMIVSYNYTYILAG